MSSTTNVKVAVRCRPMSDRERKEGHSDVVTVDDAGRATTLQTSRGPRTFTFDHSYPPEVGQDVIYRDLAQPLVEKALGGYNGTVFAYGQTGSGKTYTMMGDESVPGIIPQLHQELFECVGVGGVISHACWTVHQANEALPHCDALTCVLCRGASGAPLGAGVFGRRRARQSSSWWWCRT